MSAGQFLSWRLDLRMEGGVGIGKDLEGLDTTGDYPQGYPSVEAYAHAEWGIPLHNLREMRAAAQIVGRLVALMRESVQFNTNDTALKARLERWGNVSAIVSLKRYSDADRLRIVRAAFKSKAITAPNAKDVRKAIIGVLGKVGVHEEDRLTREKIAAMHEIEDTIKLLKPAKSLPEVSTAIQKLERARTRQIRRSSKYLKRELSYLSS